MTAPIFNFDDFLLFTNTTNVDEHMYATISAGVLGLLARQYGIYTEPTDVNVLIYRAEDETFPLDHGPLNEVTAIVHNGADVEFTTYEYSQLITMGTAPADIRIPFLISANVGFSADAEETALQLPSDLKLAIYRHIEAIHFDIKNNTDSLKKVINATGNTQYYEPEYIPEAVRNVYDTYGYKVIATFNDIELDTSYRDS